MTQRFALEGADEKVSPGLISSLCSPQNFLVDLAPWCCATAAFAPAELLLTRCTPGMDAALHSPSHTFPFFPPNPVFMLGFISQ